MTDRSSMSIDPRPVRTVTPSRSSWRCADAERSLRVGRQDPVERLDEEDPGVRRVDRAEVAPQRVAGDLAQRAGQLDAGRAAADEHEGHPSLAPRRDLPRARPPRRRSGSGAGSRWRRRCDLRPGRERRPLRRGRSRSGGRRRDDERVVGDRAAVGQQRPRAARDRARRPRRAGPSCSSGGAGSSGAAGRCRPARAAPVATW